MSWPSSLTATYCLAASTGKYSTLLMAVSRISFSASLPLMLRSARWWDWSYSTALLRQASCSSRQLVNSGVTGVLTIGGLCDSQSMVCGLPASVIFCSRLAAIYILLCSSFRASLLHGI